MRINLYHFLYVTLIFFNFFRFDATAQTVSTLAGSGTAGSTNATGVAASFNYPTGLVVDASGNVYVADSENNKIRKITAAGVVSTFAGSGTAGSTNATGVAASFNNPFGMAIDASGNIYVADRFTHKIRKITAAGVVSTFAGSGSEGSTNGTGTAASFKYPNGLAIDASGNVYVADTDNNKIRKITAAGVVSTLAGSGAPSSIDATGTAASFNGPMGVAVDASGNVYVSDTYGQKIRKITAAGVVTTLAGSGTRGDANGTGTGAMFNFPSGLVVDGSGNVYMADENNKIRKITAAGMVTTYAGSGSAGGTDGTATTASFDGPMYMAFDAGGNLYVTDYLGNRIRKIAPPVLPITLSSFTAKIQNNSIALTWQTTSEQNNKEFILSRSADGKTFTELSRIPGAGSSSSLKNYNYTDRNPLIEFNYYKLEQVDLDGKLNEGSLQVVNFKLSAAAGVMVYPNPTAKEINLTVSSAFGKEVVVSISNILGKTLYTERLQIAQGQGSYLLGNQQLPAGQYILKIKGELKTESLKVLIK